MSLAFAVHWESVKAEYAGLPPEKLAEAMQVEAREFVRVRVPGPSMTVEADKDLTDVNRIVARFKTNRLPLPFTPWGETDLTSATDYHTAMNLVAKASSSFEMLPARVRMRFNNDPGQFLAFVDDDRNYDEAVSLGLVEPDKARDKAARAKRPVEAAPAGPPKTPPAGAGSGDGGGATDGKS